MHQKYFVLWADNDGQYYAEFPLGKKGAADKDKFLQQLHGLIDSKSSYGTHLVALVKGFCQPCGIKKNNPSK